MRSPHSPPPPGRRAEPNTEGGPRSMWEERSLRTSTEPGERGDRSPLQVREVTGVGTWGHILHWAGECLQGGQKLLSARGGMTYQVRGDSGVGVEEMQQQEADGPIGLRLHWKLVCTPHQGPANPAGYQWPWDQVSTQYGTVRSPARPRKAGWPNRWGPGQAGGPRPGRWAQDGQVGPRPGRWAQAGQVGPCPIGGTRPDKSNPGLKGGVPAPSGYLWPPPQPSLRCLFPVLLCHANWAGDLLSMPRPLLYTMEQHRSRCRGCWEGEVSPCP